MKRTLIGCCALMVAVGAFAQGTVNFNNRVLPSINAPVFLVDGVTKATGPQYVAQLLGGTSATTLAPVGSPVAFKPAGILAGYFAAPTALTIPGIPAAGAATVQVAAWDSTLYPDYATAKAANGVGLSGVLSLTKTGSTTDPTLLPVNLDGLTSFNIPGVVPEPSTIALAFVGGLGLLAFRRRQ